MAYKSDFYNSRIKGQKNQIPKTVAQSRYGKNTFFRIFFIQTKPYNTVWHPLGDKRYKKIGGLCNKVNSVVITR